jgi:N-acetylmuramoyl-L-alanine amidase
MLALGACARALPTPSTSPPAPFPPEPLPAASPTPEGQRAELPPPPFVDGPLAIRVVYPVADALVAARDSNFIFGSVGSGRATLEINGVRVPVHPNGAFLAFLPVPPAESPLYELRATRDADTVVVAHPVRLLPPTLLLTDTGALVVDSASVEPRGPVIVRSFDPIRVGIRAPPNATATLVTKHSGQFAMPAGGLPPLINRDSTAEAVVLPVPDPYRRVVELMASVAGDTATIVVARGADTVRLPLPPITLIHDQLTPHLAVLGAAALLGGDAERSVVGRSVPDPSGTSKWFLFPGTVAEVIGRMSGYTRIRLDGMLSIWVEDAEVTPLEDGGSLPRPTLLSARIAPSDGWVDVVLPLGARVPFLVEERPRSLELTLYGVRVSTDAIAYSQGDSLVRFIEAVQETVDRARLTVHLDAAPFGYQTLFEDGRFILRVRRAPGVDRRSPLRGLTIAVDPGHPPIGARGPTGLYEADAVLEVAQRAQRMLEDRGATVVMTRSTADPVPLADRPIMARRANAHAFVSFHLNAYPDGVNPFIGNGTGTYFYYAHSERLARAVQRGMVNRMGLRDVGVFQQSFAVVRNSWMPAVLAEGAFLMIPEQEAALRTVAFQEAYARGVVEGLEMFFRALADER